MSESILPPVDIRPDHAGKVSHEKKYQLSPAGRSAEKPDEIRLQKACTEFESVFIAFLLKEMRATVDKSGLIDGGQSEELYQSMMDAELSRKMSAAGGLGLAKMLYEQLAARSGSGSGSPGESTKDVSAAAPQRPPKNR